MNWALAFIALAAVQPATTTPFCRDYQAVLDQAYRGFRSFRGVIEDDDDLGFDKTYRATLSLPGGTCRVNETEYTYRYICTWSHADPDDWTGAVAEARALGTALAGCSRLQFVDAGETSNKKDVVWRGMVAHQYGNRVKTEVTAQRYANTVPRRPPHKIIIVMTVSYRRETRP